MEMILLALLQTIHVEAGGKDRVDVPVAVEWDGPGPLHLEDVGGRKLPAQVCGKTLQFLVTLKAGEKAALSVKPGAMDVAGFKWVDGDLRLGERPLLRYVSPVLDEKNREATYKPFHHVFSPDGARLLTKGPGGQFTHHRGIYYGFNKVTYGDGKTCDVWHCSGQAHQAHQSVLGVDEGPVVGRHRVSIGWHGQNKDLFAVEEREVAVWNVAGGLLIDFRSTLQAKLGPVKLDGDPQHAGFHFRADNEVSAKTAKQTIYTRPDGAGKPGETRNWPGQRTHVDLPWNAMSFTLGEARYTVVYLDRPENPKEARFSERDYGRFGSYFATTVEEGKPLVVRYRLWIQEGAMDVAACASRHADFIDPPKAALAK